MRSKYLTLGALTAALLCSTGSALAADLMLDTPADVAVEDTAALPAVSGPNGKVEFSAGVVDVGDTVGVFKAGGSFSIPVGDAFGLQGDVGVSATEDSASYGAALHAFTRDPSSYLVGVTGAVIGTDDGDVLGAVGPELELYLNQFTMEAWAGFAGIDYDDPVLGDDDGVFVIADLAWYATDDLRLAIGGSSVLGENALNLSAEYQLSSLGLPMSLTGKVSLNDDDDVTATIGLKGYFGAPSSKTLIERHRQDDPRNRVLDLVDASNSTLNATAAAGPDEPEIVCDVDELPLIIDGEVVGCLPSLPSL